jgi:hypothetical protein
LAKISNLEYSVFKNRLTPAVVILICVSVLLLYLWASILNQEKYLETICAGLSGKFRSVGNLWEKISTRKGSYQFVGQYSQRSFIIEYFYRWKTDERLEVRFPVIQKFWLRFILEPAHSPQPEEITLGIPELDVFYVIHSNQPQAAKEFLRSQIALVDLQRLKTRFDRLEIHHGWGKAEFYSPAKRGFDRGHLELVLESLARFFSNYESQSKVVVAIEISRDERCPYCRGMIAKANQRIIKCSQCGSHIHENCWKENKQCTTWGCESTVGSLVL